MSNKSKISARPAVTPRRSDPSNHAAMYKKVDAILAIESTTAHSGQTLHNSRSLPRADIDASLDKTGHEKTLAHTSNSTSLEQHISTQDYETSDELMRSYLEIELENQRLTDRLSDALAAIRTLYDSQMMSNRQSSATGSNDRRHRNGPEQSQRHASGEPGASQRVQSHSFAFPENLKKRFEDQARLLARQQEKRMREATEKEKEISYLQDQLIINGRTLDILEAGQDSMWNFITSLETDLTAIRQSHTEVMTKLNIFEARSEKIDRALLSLARTKAAQV